MDIAGTPGGIFPYNSELYQMYCVLHNTKQWYIFASMKAFGETIRDLRVAQDLGLRETAALVGISPAYLSRIERGKERPPRPEVIKTLAKTLAADPDVLFRLSSSTDPEIVDYLHDNPEAMILLRYLKDAGFTPEKIKQLFGTAQELSDSKRQKSPTSVSAL
ncbi:helix-turn-helix domain-containing protein [Thiolapillus sp.]|uniref:helix-turn-helix domain-containing protein n=3 Tax=Thiolapillus sp. TaxID=2017437 RepID=UPI0025FE617C|nr:helix-turn-helix transcriptional regulator [Thiolapillus sp.]